MKMKSTTSLPSLPKPNHFPLHFGTLSHPHPATIRSRAPGAHPRWLAPACLAAARLRPIFFVAKIRGRSEQKMDRHV